MPANVVTLEMAKTDLGKARDRVIAAAKDAISGGPESMWELNNAVSALGYFEDRLARIDAHSGAPYREITWEHP